MLPLVGHETGPYFTVLREALSVVRDARVGSCGSQSGLKVFWRGRSKSEMQATLKVMNNFFVKTLSIYFYCFLSRFLAVFDAELPVNVEIACEESDADCPADGQGERFCELRLAPPACRYKENRDVQLPELTETSLDPKHGMVGTILTATFTANEALMEDNLVVSEGSDTLTFTRDTEADAAENHYVFTYTVSGNENEGVQNAKAVIQDRGGNTVEVDIGSVTLDFTAPVIGDVSLVHDRP